MKDIKKLIEKNYPLKIDRLHKEKSSYICRTNKGLYKFSQTFENISDIIFQYDLINTLEKRNFFNIDSLLLSKNNLPYITTNDNSINKGYMSNGSRFVMKKYFDFTNVSFKDNGDILNAVRNLGTLHNNLRDVNIKKKVSENKSIINDVENDTEVFYNIYKFIRNQKKYSDFDIIFINNFERNMENITECKSIFIKNDIDDIISRNISDNTVCHGNLKECNLKINNDIIIFDNFTPTCFNSQIFDLAFIIERYLINISEKPIPIKDVLKVYDNKHLDDNELKHLYPLIKYPSKYISLCKEYYTKKRNWIPNKFPQKCNLLLEKQQLYDDYIYDIKF